MTYYFKLFWFCLWFARLFYSLFLVHIDISAANFVCQKKFLLKGATAGLV